MNTPALLLMLFVSLFCLFYLFLWPDARSQLPRRFQLYLLMFVVFAGVFFLAFLFAVSPSSSNEIHKMLKIRLPPLNSFHFNGILFFLGGGEFMFLNIYRFLHFGAAVVSYLIMG